MRAKFKHDGKLCVISCVRDRECICRPCFTVADYGSGKFKNYKCSTQQDGCPKPIPEPNHNPDRNNCKRCKIKIAKPKIPGRVFVLNGLTRRIHTVLSLNTYASRETIKTAVGFKNTAESVLFDEAYQKALVKIQKGEPIQ